MTDDGWSGDGWSGDGWTTRDMRWRLRNIPLHGRVSVQWHHERATLRIAD
jgi:hypothetical protein